MGNPDIVERLLVKDALKTVFKAWYSYGSICPEDLAFSFHTKLAFPDRMIRGVRHGDGEPDTSACHFSIHSLHTSGAAGDETVGV